MTIQNASSAAVLEDGLHGNDARPLYGDNPTDQEARDSEFLSLAKSAFDESTDFLTGFIQKGWSRSIDHFNSKHARGSRYLSSDYNDRARLFRPKTRSMVRRAEADCARAFFSTQDVVNIAPVNDAEPRELASADIVNALMNYRLTKTVPWFRILMGQYQTTQVMGLCVSKQYWAYEEEVTKTGRMVVRMDPVTGQMALDPETGAPIVEEEEARRVVRDELVIEPIPPENVRVHPGADWLDPIQKSAYVIYRFPMLVGAIRERAKMVDPKTGQPKWREIDKASLAGSMVNDQSMGLREKRDGGVDRFDRPGMTESETPDNALAWVHENIVRKDGRDWQFYTLADRQLLSDPTPLEEVYFLDERPFTWGIGNIEAFRLIPESKVGMLFDLQVRANHLDNLRLDNVFQALHPKVLVKQSSTIDLRALTSPRVGGAVMVPGNPAESVMFVRPPDVTSSSYQEQNMLNLDMDDLGGGFSGSSVQSNRQLNETVGGMNLLAGNASLVGEYELRIFAETWVEPTLRQCVKLEQKYETDATVIALAGKQAETWQRYGLDPLTDDLLSAELTVTVNVGIGATNPEQRQQRFMGAIASVWKIMEPMIQLYGPGVLESPGVQAIVKETFGLAGYKDGKRFMDLKPPPGEGEEPDPAQLQQLVEQLTAELEKLQQEKAAGTIKSQADLQREQMQQQGETERTVLEIQGRAQVNERRIQAEEADRQMQSLLAALRPAPAQPMQSRPMSARI